MENKGENEKSLGGEGGGGKDLGSCKTCSLQDTRWWSDEAGEKCKEKEEEKEQKVLLWQPRYCGGERVYIVNIYYIVPVPIIGGLLR